MINPAAQLKGVDLGNGWRVLDFAKRGKNATGGTFSHGYIVEHTDGQKGFLKAMDYTEAFRAKHTSVVLAAMANAYNFEKTLCDKVAHLTRVARAIESGSFNPNPDPTSKVEYLIFELADRDIRAQLDLQADLDTVFVLKTLHHVAVGLKQLHQADVAHQDLKPSNVLYYPQAGSKICDLGRAWDRGAAAPHDSFPIAGDPMYAPMEAYYDEIPSEERARRFGCDMYHLGSLLFFCFTRAHPNAVIIDHLDPRYRPGFWGGNYEDVLPFVQAAFEMAVEDFAQEVPPHSREELSTLVQELCNPDWRRRGHPKNQGRVQFSLERYVSRFNLLADRAALAMVGTN